jgi:hypothetical protein
LDEDDQAALRPPAQPHAQILGSRRQQSAAIGSALRDGAQGGIEGDVVFSFQVAKWTRADVTAVTVAGSDLSAPGRRRVHRRAGQVEIRCRNQRVGIEDAFFVFFFTK